MQKVFDNDSTVDPLKQVEDKRRKARAFLLDRQRAYRKVFGGKDKATKQVFEDLKYFCRADVSCFHEDPRMHAVLEGRREVILRIGHHLDLNTDDMLNTYMGED